MARILLIDDEPSIRVAMGRYLRLKGHDVVEVENGAEAMRIARGGPLDLVITDINMPEMDGIEVIVALADLAPGLPVIAVSGGGRMPGDVLLANAKVLGAVTTLQKPFDLSVLGAAVGAALAER